MPGSKDIAGQRFGKLTAIETFRDERGVRKWRCQCECGGALVSTAGHLRYGRITSCGCNRLKNDLTGQRFSKLLVLSRSHNHGKAIYWNVECDCGVRKTIDGQNLLRGHTKSCGNHRAPAAKNHPLYVTWQNMLRRCLDKKNASYHNYGGRGIYVCEAWRNSFQTFAMDMGQRPNGLTLERINNNGPYSPENCKWATQTEQMRNTRINKIVMAFRGESKTIAEWAEITGIKASIIGERLRAGWSAEAALIKRPKIVK